MSDRRYINRVGGTTDGRIGWNQHARPGARELGAEWPYQQHECGVGDGGLDSGEEQQRIVSGDCVGYDERQFDGRPGSRGAEHPGRPIGQGGSAAGGDCERQLQCLVVGCSEQDSGQSAQIVHTSLLDEGNAVVGASEALTHLIGKAIDALTHLDADALEELCWRTADISSLPQGSSRAMLPALERKIISLSGLLRATAENLAILRRAEAQRSWRPEATRGQASGKREASSSGAYSDPRGLFESFGLYTEEEADSSIWPPARPALRQEAVESTISRVERQPMGLV